MGAPTAWWDTLITLRWMSAPAAVRTHRRVALDEQNIKLSKSHVQRTTTQRKEVVDYEAVLPKEGNHFFGLGSTLHSCDRTRLNDERIDIEDSVTHTAQYEDLGTLDIDLAESRPFEGAYNLVKSPYRD